MPGVDAIQNARCVPMFAGNVPKFAGVFNKTPIFSINNKYVVH